ncbi:hypothetical protein [Terribacillus sp. JSM ZJ617]|uniref:hypothetical protein n=1 Tax=Terribacillus sp. JSM ZJ617 TaxID=3342119 RepID=UPI0035A92C5F
MKAPQHGDRYIRIYYMHVQGGMNPREALAVVTRVIAGSYGTMNDIRQLIDAHDAYQLNQFKEWETKRNVQDYQTAAVGS